MGTADEGGDFAAVGFQLERAESCFFVLCASANDDLVDMGIGGDESFGGRVVRVGTAGRRPRALSKDDGEGPDVGHFPAVEG